MAGQVGLDYLINRDWLLNMSVWYMDIDTEVKYKSNGAVLPAGRYSDTYALTRGYLCSLRVTASNFLTINKPPDVFLAVCLKLTSCSCFHRLYKSFQCRQHFLWLINMLLDDFNNGRTRNRARSSCINRCFYLIRGGNTKSLQWRCSVVLFKLRNQMIEG